MLDVAKKNISLVFRKGKKENKKISSLKNCLVNYAARKIEWLRHVQH
jgi:hypothetical protein